MLGRFGPCLDRSSHGRIMPRHAHSEQCVNQGTSLHYQMKNLNLQKRIRDYEGGPPVGGWRLAWKAVAMGVLTHSMHIQNSVNLGTALHYQMKTLILQKKDPGLWGRHPCWWIRSMVVTIFFRGWGRKSGERSWFQWIVQIIFFYVDSKVSVLVVICLITCWLDICKVSSLGHIFFWYLGYSYLSDICFVFHIFNSFILVSFEIIFSDVIWILRSYDSELLIIFHPRYQRSCQK